MPRAPDAVLISYPDASLIEIHRTYTLYPRQGGGGRGSVQGFSRASRKRMLNLLNRIEQTAYKRAKLITLTYHKNERDHVKSKKHLHRFLTYLRRNHTDHSGVWRLEWQDRGAIHYHILTFGRFICHKEIAKTWTSIADPGNSEHLKAGTEIRAVRRARSGVAYVSKYMGKPTPTADEPCPFSDGNGGDDKLRGWYSGRCPADFQGRVWGVFNRRALPLAGAEAVVISSRRAEEAIERLSALYGFRSSAAGTFRLFTRGGVTHKETINQIIGGDNAIPTNDGAERNGVLSDSGG